jgi:hypothetical protein
VLCSRQNGAPWIRPNTIVSKRFPAEKLSREAADRANALAWAEIAIEWHALSFQAAQHHDIEFKKLEVIASYSLVVLHLPRTPS